MRLGTVRIDGARAWGVFTDDAFVNVGVLTEWPSLRLALAADFRPDATLLARATRVPLAEVVFEPVIPDPAKIICVGVNYASHAAELGRPCPGRPALFIRVPHSIVGHQEPLEYPSGSDAFDFEGELAVVIGRRCRAVSEADAAAVIAGYTCFGDHSARDWQAHSSQVTAGKNFDRSGACGPWLTTADEAPAPEAMTITTRVNGRIRQDASLAELLFSVPRLLAYVSSFTTLEPGDVLSTGTPAGVGCARKPPEYLRAGDVIEVEIPAVGLLRNTVSPTPFVPMRPSPPIAPRSPA